MLKDQVYIKPKNGGGKIVNVGDVVTRSNKEFVITKLDVTRNATYVYIQSRMDENGKTKIYGSFTFLELFTPFNEQSKAKSKEN